LHSLASQEKPSVTFFLALILYLVAKETLSLPLPAKPHRPPGTLKRTGKAARLLSTLKARVCHRLCPVRPRALPPQKQGRKGARLEAHVAAGLPPPVPCSIASVFTP